MSTKPPVEGTESAALGRKRRRIPKLFLTDPTEGVPAFWIVTWVLLGLVAVLGFFWVMKPAPVTINYPAAGEPVAATEVVVSGWRNPLETLPEPLHPTANQLLVVCDGSSEFCDFDQQRADDVFSAFVAGEHYNERCEVQFGFDEDLLVTMTTVPTLGLVPLLDCAADSENEGIVLYEGAELPGLDRSEFGGE